MVGFLIEVQSFFSNLKRIKMSVFSDVLLFGNEVVTSAQLLEKIVPFSKEFIDFALETWLFFAFFDAFIEERYILNVTFLVTKRSTTLFVSFASLFPIAHMLISLTYFLHLFNR